MMMLLASSRRVMSKFTLSLPQKLLGAKLPLLHAPTINCLPTLHVPPGRCFWEGSVLWGRVLLRGEPVCWSIGTATHNEALRTISGQSAPSSWPPFDSLLSSFTLE
jgi:hypothetical protein